MTRATALIVGGGIGGLSAALALLRVGFDVKLFERSNHFEELGAGITLRPSANRALHYLGLYEALLEKGSRPPSMPVRHYKTGGVLVGRKAGSPSHADFPMMQMHRADLIGVMVNALGRRAPDAMRSGHDLVGFDQAEDSVTARFADGSEEKGDVLIGCDGVRSVVRAQMFGVGSPRFTGQVAWRCLIPMDRVRHLVSDSPGGTYIGPGRVFTRYPIRQGALLNCVAFARTDAWKTEGWSTPSTRDELTAQFVGWHGDVIGLIDQAPSEGLIKWALFDRDPLPIWTQGRASLLGDAAHPMLPFLGLGAGVALEDSVVLARALAETDSISAGLKRYEAARRDRTAKILLASRVQGEIYGRADPENYAATERPAADMVLVEAYDPVSVAI